MNKNNSLKVKIDIPGPVSLALGRLLIASKEVFVVGGCVRDVLLGKKPQDWDLTTNAKPEELLEIFPQGKYQNDFGTVIVPWKYLLDIDNVSRETIKPDFLEKVNSGDNLEITTYRIEARYSDRRHPDRVSFADSIEEDLARRDFTINAMALRPDTAFLVNLERFLREDALINDCEFEMELLDLFQGRKDLKEKLVRSVGSPWERFDEDALRMMRAVRFACQLGFEVERATREAILSNQSKLRFVSQERIRDELIKILTSPQPAQGIRLLDEVGLLVRILPEVAKAKGVRQNKHHYFGPFNTVFAHMVASLEKCPSEKLTVRLAALLHDVGKPPTKRGQGKEATFHGHEYVGAKMTQKTLEYLRFPRKTIEKVILLVKNHMFYYNVDEVGEAGVRRLVRKVGLENIQDLLDVRIADRLGSGVPKAVPYKLRHFQFMVDKVSQDPLSVKQLVINGRDLIRELGLSPGPRIGAILEVLLSRVLDNPSLNRKDQLLNLAKELEKQDLSQLRKEAKKEIEKEKQSKEKQIKKRHHV